MIKFKNKNFKIIDEYPNYGISKDGVILSLNRNKIRIQFENKSGYVQCGLYKNGIKKLLSVHRLVAETYISKIVDKEIINHKNGVKSDNRLENLEWCTHSYNHLHRCRILKRGVGVDQHLSKLNEVDVRKIRKLRDLGCRPHEIKSMFPVDVRSIYRVMNNETWRHIN